MAFPFTVKIGEFRLSPRPRYIIEKEEINFNIRADETGNPAEQCVNTEDGECVSPVESQEIIFTVRCIGNGDLKAADVAYRELRDYLAEICSSNLQEYYRRVKDEEPMIVKIGKAYIRPIDLEYEHSCEGTKSGEVHLFSLELNEGTEIATYNYTVPKPGT